MKRETGIRNIGFSDCEELANWSNEQCGECCANSQYSGSKCLEVVGIPSSVNIKDLEGKVCIVFNRIGPAIKAHGIEAYHRL